MAENRTLSPRPGMRWGHLLSPHLFNSTRPEKNPKHKMGRIERSLYLQRTWWSPQKIPNIRPKKPSRISEFCKVVRYNANTYTLKMFPYINSVEPEIFKFKISFNPKNVEHLLTLRYVFYLGINLTRTEFEILAIKFMSKNSTFIHLFNECFWAPTTCQTHSAFYLYGIPLESKLREKGQLSSVLCIKEANSVQWDLMLWVLRWSLLQL